MKINYRNNLLPLLASEIFTDTLPDNKKAGTVY